MFKTIRRKLVGKSGRKGYTLTELMSVVAIIAVVCAIAIPSVIAIHRSLTFRQNNDYAKSIFMAAQANLTDMRSDGQLVDLAAAPGADGVPEFAADFPANDWSDEYVFTTSKGTDTTAFDLVLPVNSIDSKVRDGNILIEYNPYTGNVYSVFFTHSKDELAYGNGTLARDKDARKKLLLGYYCGSGLSSTSFELEKEEAEIKFINGEEGIVQVSIPIPDSYKSSANAFAEGLNVQFNIAGKDAKDDQQTIELLAKRSGVILSDANKWSSYEIKDGKVIVSYVLDSLRDNGSFANLVYGNTAQERNEQIGQFATVTKAAEKTNDGATHITQIANNSKFKILPGSNISIGATIRFESGDGSNGIKIECGALENVNPMLGSLDKSARLSDKFIIGIENGRNLQNLNAIDPQISAKVSNVSFNESDEAGFKDKKGDIYWNDTVEYYNNKYSAGETYSNDTVEAPARCLPYFVPINNEALFGGAQFIYPDAAGDLGKQLRGAIADLISGAVNNVEDVINRIFRTDLQHIRIVTDTDSDTPTLTDELDRNAAGHASIDGGAHKVYYLNVNTGKYATSLSKSTYYAGNSEAGNSARDKFTGLFGYINTDIHDLYVVNPLIKGSYFTGNNSANQKNNPAVGALVGAAGWNAYIYNCGAYIDKNDKDFNQALMTQKDFDKNENNDQSFYGVSGCGAVGGLVGYVKSHSVLSNELTAESAKQNHLAYTNCFASLFVSGLMRGTDTSLYQQSDILDDPNYFGYTNGVGGLVGNSELTNFYGCYSGSNVMADGVYVQYLNGFKAISNMVCDMLGAKKLDLPYDGRASMGAGGLVGTSHGSVYTNCFTSGNIVGKNTNSQYISTLSNIMNRLGITNKSGKLAGTAGFVGVMNYSESYAYGNGNTSAVEVAGISQKSMFVSCYSAGTSKVYIKENGTTNSQDISENFTGANARINSDFNTLTKYWSGNFYDVYAPLWFTYGDNDVYDSKNGRGAVGQKVFEKVDGVKVNVDHTRGSLSYMETLDVVKEAQMVFDKNLKYDVGLGIDTVDDPVSENKKNFTTKKEDAGKTQIDLYTLPYQSYVFKDSYYLINYSADDVTYSNDFGRCGLPLEYEYLTDLSFYHTNADANPNKSASTGWIEHNKNKTGWVDEQIDKVKKNSVVEWANDLKDHTDDYDDDDDKNVNYDYLDYGGVYFGDWLFDYGSFRNHDKYSNQVFYRYEAPADAGQGGMLARIIINQSARKVGEGGAQSDIVGKNAILGTDGAILFTNVYYQYHPNFTNTISDLYDIYVKLYSLGFKSSANGGEWNKANAGSTHGYELIDTNTVYPFTKLSGRDYYGNWPSKPMTAGLAYYEAYENENGDISYGYYFDRESTSTLSNDLKVISDGYAILTANSDDLLSIKINGKEISLSEFSDPTTFNATYYTGNKSYSVHVIPWSAISAACTDYKNSSEYYSKVEADVKVTDANGATSTKTFTMYFNPNVALSQINPVSDGTNLATTATKPGTAPSAVYIRTARQFASLQNMTSFWGENYNYVQMLDINASDYNGSSYGGSAATAAAYAKNNGVVGTANNPFNASYNGHNGYVESALLTGFNNTNSYFGYIGDKGSVSYLTLDCAGSYGSGDSYGVLASENHGKIDNITANVSGALTLNANTNAGVIVGLSKGGTISNCTVTADGAVSSSAQNLGLVAGATSGIYENNNLKASGKLTNCTVTVTENGGMTAANGNVGAVAGKLDGVEVSNATVTVAGAINGKNAGGFAGDMSKANFSIASVDVSGNIVGTETAGGFVGNCSGSSTLSDTHITLNSAVSDKFAGGVAGKASALNASNNTYIDLKGSVNGSELAGGAIGSMNGGRFSAFNVNLNSGSRVNSDGGTAAGFAGVCGGEVSGSYVNSNGATISGANAAGFAGSITDDVDSCSVRGPLTITASGDAAGFAISASKGVTVNICKVTPVASNSNVTSELKAAYRDSYYNMLNVVGAKRAAGFIVDIADATVESCDALGTVGTAPQEDEDGETAESTAVNAGFAINVGKNSSINKCIANTVVYGTAFIENNSGNVFNSYAWCNDSADIDTCGDEENAYFACYIGVRAGDGADPKSQKISVFLPDNSKEATLMPLTELTPEILNGGKTSGVWGKMTSYESYPFSAMTPPEYTFPMLRIHLGDWTNTVQESYGIVYYEVLEDGTVDMQLWDMNGSDENFGYVRYDKNGDYIGWPNAGTFALNSISDGNDKKIVGTGYAVFYSNPAQIRGIGDKKLSGFTQELTADYLKTKYELDADVSFNGSAMTFGGETSVNDMNVFDTFMSEYTMTVISEDSVNAGALNVKGISGNSYTVMQGFAQDATPSTESHGEYVVRTGNQFVNIGGIEGESYKVSQTHNLRLEVNDNIGKGELKGDELNGSYNGHGNAILFTEPEEGENSNIETGIFLNLAANAGVENVTVKGAKLNATFADGQSAGVVANSVGSNCKLSNIELRNCDVIYNNVENKANLNVGVLAGNINGAKGNSSAVSKITLTACTVSYGNEHKKDIEDDLRNGTFNVGTVAGAVNYAEISDITVQKLTEKDDEGNETDYPCRVSYVADSIRNNALNIGGIVGVLGENVTVANSEVNDAIILSREAKVRTDDTLQQMDIYIGGVVGRTEKADASFEAVSNVTVNNTAVSVYSEAPVPKDVDKPDSAPKVSAGAIVGEARQFANISGNSVDSTVDVDTTYATVFAGAIVGRGLADNAISGSVSMTEADAENPNIKVVTDIGMIHAGSAVGVLSNYEGHGKGNIETCTVEKSSVYAESGNGYLAIGGAVGQQDAGSINATVSDVSINGTTERTDDIMAGGLVGFTNVGTLSGTATNPTIELTANSSNVKTYKDGNLIEVDVLAGGAVGYINDNPNNNNVTILNCTVENPKLTGHGDASVFAGGVVGRAIGGTVKDCTVTANDSAFDVSAKDATRSEFYFGGAVGHMNGVGGISGCTVSTSKGISLTAPDGQSSVYAGGIVSATDRHITNCAVTTSGNAKFTLDASETPTANVHFGGIVGKSYPHANITGGSASTVNMLYKPGGNNEQVWVGGIVAEMDCGTLSNMTVNGEIELNGSKSGAYIVGGAVGSDMSSVNGSFATYSGTTANVKIDKAWASAKSAADYTSHAGLGAVGKFVGFAIDGHYSNCNGNGRYGDTSKDIGYEFVGMVNVSVNSTSLSNPYYSYDIVNSTSIIAERVDSTDNSYKQHDGSLMLTKADVAAASARHNYKVVFEECYYLDGSGNKYKQEFDTLYYYSKNNDKDYKAYTVSSDYMTRPEAGKKYMLLDSSSKNSNSTSYGMIVNDSKSLVGTVIKEKGVTAPQSFRVYYDDNTNKEKQQAIWSLSENGNRHVWQNYISGMYLYFDRNNVGISDAYQTIYPHWDGNNYTIAAGLVFDEGFSYTLRIDGTSIKHAYGQYEIRPYEVTIENDYWRADFAYNSSDQIITSTPVT